MPARLASLFSPVPPSHKCQDTKTKSHNSLYSFGLGLQITSRAFSAAWGHTREVRRLLGRHVLIPHRARDDPQSNFLPLPLALTSKANNSSCFSKAGTGCSLTLLLQWTWLSSTGIDFPSCAHHDTWYLGGCITFRQALGCNGNLTVVTNANEARGC